LGGLMAARHCLVAAVELLLLDGMRGV
jgi:hypothetical protein